MEIGKQRGIIVNYHCTLKHHVISGIMNVPTVIRSSQEVIT